MAASLTRAQLVSVARSGAAVTLDRKQLERVQRAADFLADKVSCGEPTYGVTTGFGSNADKLLGAHRLRDELPGGNPHAPDGSLLEELQRNLIITHAVCVGKPFDEDVVRAMLLIRINTLMRGHSGIRVSTLEAADRDAQRRAWCRWCRRRVQSAQAVILHRYRIWPSSCSAAARRAFQRRAHERR